MTVATVMLAHQGGWDEFLLVAAPIVVIIGVLVVVKRRVDAQPLDDEQGPTDDRPLSS